MRSRAGVAACATALLVALGCGARDAAVDDTDRTTAGGAAAGGVADPAPGLRENPRSRDVEGAPRIVALGDSLTAGLGLEADEAYPARLQARVNAAGLRYEVVNAGVSGDTSAGGLRRLDWALDGNVRVLIVALGGNDALRGLPVDELRRNLSAIIERAQAQNVAVVLAGMEAPPNFGQAYTTAFRDVYAELARKYDVAFVPFLLDGVAGLPSMNQRDGIHPTAEGASRVADNVWAALEPQIATR